MEEIKLMGFGEPDKDGEQRAKSQKSNSPQSKTTPNQTNVKKRQIDISFEPIKGKQSHTVDVKKQVDVRTNSTGGKQSQVNIKHNQQNIKQSQPVARSNQQNIKQSQVNVKQSQQNITHNTAVVEQNPANRNRQPPSRDEARQSSSRVHKRRRKKNYTLYYIFLAFLLTIVLVSLSLTVLFNVSDIIIDNYPNVNKENIIASSTLKIGDNLLRMDTKKIAARILNENIMLDSVSVKRKFPNSVEISLDLSEPKIGIKNGSEYHYFSNAGRYFTTSDQRSGLIFQGVDVSKIALGEYLTKAAADEQEIVKTLQDAIEETKIPHITYADVRDISSIKLYYKDEIEIKIGNISQIKYKLEKAREIINASMDEGQVGQLDVQVYKKAFFRPIDFVAPW